mmetsp:Transcript_14703/g.21954  ORF Transcript_14703/g.21954 Transcript_14703/m.21954 type:complete len:177 (-) Transcript_14703:118-648(-)
MTVNDEIDTHVGGRAAVALAKLLAEQTRSPNGTDQIISITHSPSGAAVADRHIVIQKLLRATTWKGESKLLLKTWGVRCEEKSYQGWLPEISHPTKRDCGSLKRYFVKGKVVFRRKIRDAGININMEMDEISPYGRVIPCGIRIRVNITVHTIPLQIVGYPLKIQIQINYKYTRNE